MELEHGDNWLNYAEILDDGLIRILVILEVLARSIKDFSKFLRRLFGQTWEYRILEALVKEGPMNKSQIASIISGKNRSYKLSRKSPVNTAFTHLLMENIIVVKKDYGHVKIYYVNKNFEPILKVIIG